MPAVVDAVSIVAPFDANDVTIPAFIRLRNMPLTMKMMSAMTRCATVYAAQLT